MNALIINLRMVTGTLANKLRARMPEELGQDLIEYAMLGGLIAAAIVAVGVLVYSGALSSMATGIGNCIDFTSSTGCNPGF